MQTMTTNNNRHQPATAKGQGLPSWRALSALVAVVFAGGILAGAALGPPTENSLANNSTIVQRVIALLAAQGGGGSRPSAPTTSGTPAGKSKAGAIPTRARATHSKTKPKVTPAGASTPSSSGRSSSEFSPGSEHSSSGHGNEGEQAAPGKPIRLPPIQHVWLIMLGGSTFAGAAATPSSYPYLAGQLLGQGTLLTSYSALDAYELAGDATLLPGGVAASLSVISEPGCGAAPTPGAGAPCAEGTQPSPPESDAFLERVVAPILSSLAYREDGLIVITFASAFSSAGAPATTLTLQPAAGALLLSPLLHAGAQSSSPFDSLSPRTSLQTIFRH